MSHYIQYQPEWIREDFIDFIAEKINPVWAWKKIKASIIKTRAFSAGFYQIQLRPNHNFKSQQFKAGQSVLLTVVIEGIRQQRSYSIVKILANGDVLIAVKQQGKVSNALTQMDFGSIVELSQSQGEFVLDDCSHSILLLASGSGITAIYALLQDALSRNIQNIDLIYFTRDDAFHLDFEQLVQQYPQFNYHPVNTSQQKQHLTLELLQRFVPDFQQRQSYACGAKAMMQSLNQIYQQFGISQQLKQEYFQVMVDETLAVQPVTFLRSQQKFEAKSNLLESAEQAGLRPTHGCRMGICNTCTCTKVSGSTKNILTGEIDHSSQTQIKLCISQAVSPVVINL
ncbi:flavin reductase family protein [Acinetobacter sp. ANC 4648]|uniref:flavin reductase family protein n=1 Tax=Acinetobacter sp. ANC 4648 TaxID=1977875 RepID=UPI000A340C5B|nr:iron-sulfur cluster-binding domain-containing protein [Acinetobacter sp. ANC 4648]OTG85195.1 oxidoreductase [Acinetobacter sp. ANC 4648]